jgi:hypothetical protein
MESGIKRRDTIELHEHMSCGYGLPKDAVSKHIPWYTRLYRGIMVALFGPESHAVNRYEDQEATK